MKKHPSSRGLSFVYRYITLDDAEEEVRDLLTRGIRAEVWPVYLPHGRLFEVWTKQEAVR